MPPRSIVRFTVNMDLSRAALEHARKILQGAPKKIARHRAHVGIQETEGGEPKKDYHGVEGARSLAEVMRAHEFGTDVLPERSWLRAWFDANVDRLAGGMLEAMQAEFEGDKEAVRNWIRGETDEWRAWIEAGGDFTGLAPRTIAEKTAAGLAHPETPLVAVEQFVRAFRARMDGRDA